MFRIFLSLALMGAGLGAFAESQAKLRELNHFERLQLGTLYPSPQAVEENFLRLYAAHKDDAATLELLKASFEFLREPKSPTVEAYRKQLNESVSYFPDEFYQAPDFPSEIAQIPKTFPEELGMPDWERVWGERTFEISSEAELRPLVLAFSELPTPPIDDPAQLSAVVDVYENLVFKALELLQRATEEEIPRLVGAIAHLRMNYLLNWESKYSVRSDFDCSEVWRRVRLPLLRTKLMVFHKLFTEMSRSLPDPARRSSLRLHFLWLDMMAAHREAGRQHQGNKFPYLRPLEVEAALDDIIGLGNEATPGGGRHFSIARAHTEMAYAKNLEDLESVAREQQSVALAAKAEQSRDARRTAGMGSLLFSASSALGYGISWIADYFSQYGGRITSGILSGIEQVSFWGMATPLGAVSAGLLVSSGVHLYSDFVRTLQARGILRAKFVPDLPLDSDPLSFARHFEHALKLIEAEKSPVPHPRLEKIRDFCRRGLRNLRASF